MAQHGLDRAVRVSGGDKCAPQFRREAQCVREAKTLVSKLLKSGIDEQEPSAGAADGYLQFRTSFLLPLVKTLVLPREMEVS